MEWRACTGCQIAFLVSRLSSLVSRRLRSTEHGYCDYRVLCSIVVDSLRHIIPDTHISQGVICVQHSSKYGGQRWLAYAICSGFHLPLISDSISLGGWWFSTLNKIFIRTTEITMRKNHVVRKQGYFKVEVAQHWSIPSRPSRLRYFHSFKGAYRYLRYHVSFLGWNYGVLEFVEQYNPYNLFTSSRVLFVVDKDAEA